MADVWKLGYAGNHLIYIYIHIYTCCYTECRPYAQNNVVLKVYIFK